MYKHVLVPVQLDDSRDVSTACAVARKLLQDNGRISFLHALEPIPMMVGTYVPEIHTPENRQFAKERLAEIAEAIPNAQIALTDGKPGRAITQWADDNNVDCIVIASHQPALSDVLLGSTAAWVVRHATCPVHVVR
jgi:nucleotide-binding universal stress UspA family protein